MATNETARAFGREVRRRRHALGLTLEAFSAGAGLSPGYIGTIETGLRDPSLSTMEKLAAGLGAPLGELIGTPKLSPDAIEAARVLSALPRDVRRSIVGALKAIATWAEGRRP